MENETTFEKLQNEWNDFWEKNYKIAVDPGLDYQLQEQLKTISWGLLREFEKEENYLAAARVLLEGIIRSHYWRARNQLENNPKCKTKLRKIRGKKYYKHYELDIDHYTNHWLAANGDRRDLFSDKTLEIIKNNYGYKEENNKYLPHGMTMYQGFNV